MLAYAGLRPGEALNLRWQHVGQRTVTVYAKKTGQRRNVRLLTPLAEDLRAWRRAPGSPDRTRWCSRPRRRAVVEEAYKWLGEQGPRGRKRRTARAAAPAGVRAGGPGGRCAAATPYTLRHSFCSLLLHEGRSVIYVARQIGHDAKLTLRRTGT